ncbi:aminotransferase class V-fold PLP-dependent enzyme [Mycoplasmopsis agalactiae]|uniref:aminotransferase class V-fold PLP-dependent enzyme n=1 Tax=Mycoplasmopsis agalactiae TaxID=2110 RepID=UPI001455E0A7|nr:aminotransferase class V-fold PLP-dependent enzyme [Mycoplasmopsis agalactiae]MCE6056873.1 aminotransferase class V-fold PLP-dependent enzyme [Mycoplasmopsis agalactiae]MCE6078662.1 aminotransferase class V-fold PLP-dependent enzyme [Mycoplasmopsis agalactiae]MCE6095047.1 aminotransferase class V-fold PLP-dependent enzyme [Mycoplasmopsis agalactiae]NLS34715.1 aminotransferase class V-fold PLP-dependent enzyme [Mycoplasmopsis agalactiae]
MPKSIRSFFPLAYKIVYLDTAALALKPKPSITESNNFYNLYSVSTRTNDSPLGIYTNKIVNEVRRKIALLTDAKENEVIFTSGATDSLNKFAQMYMQKLKAGDQIILHGYNHSSNMIPWTVLAKEHNIDVKIVDTPDLESAINSKTKVVAFSQLTNNFQVKIDIESLYKKCHKVGAILVNDAAQAIVYEKVSLQNCDVIAFSANKFYGPTGLGALIVKEHILKELDPVTFGGGTINSVNKDNSFIIKNSIEKFEPGTLNFAAIFMFNRSIDFFNQYIGYEKSKQILKKLSNYAYDELLKVQNIEIYSKRDDHIILFNIKGINSQDVAHFLGVNNIYVRSGIFCAHYLKNFACNDSFVRVSLGVYNNKNDINKLTHALKKGGDFIVL